MLPVLCSLPLVEPAQQTITLVEGETVRRSTVPQLMSTLQTVMWLLYVQGVALVYANVAFLCVSGSIWMHRELRRSTMKRHPATTLWLASVVLLAVMATSGYAQDFPSCPRNCSCAREDRDEFEVTCPSDGERIALKLQPRSKAVFLCQVNTVSDDFTLLKDVSVDAGSAMEFRLCPLPDVAFTDILRVCLFSLMHFYLIRFHFNVL